MADGGDTSTVDGIPDAAQHAHPPAQIWYNTIRCRQWSRLRALPPDLVDNAVSLTNRRLDGARTVRKDLPPALEQLDVWLRSAHLTIGSCFGIRNLQVENGHELTPVGLVEPNNDLIGQLIVRGGVGGH